MASFRITFSIEPGSTAAIIVKKQTVGDFLAAVRRMYGNNDYNYAFKDGILLNNDELLSDIDPKSILIVSKTEVISDEFELIDDDFGAKDTDPKKKPIAIDFGAINTDPIKKPIGPPAYPAVPEKVDASIKKFKVYSTVTPTALLDGHDMNLSLDTNVDQIILIMNAHIKDIFPTVIDDFDLFVYLPTGIPFVSGTIREWFNCQDVSPVLYVIVTRKIGQDLLNKRLSNVCNCSDNDSKLLLSPYYDSTDIGYTRIAAFLGYFYFDGNQAENLLRVIAKTIKFAPLVTSLFHLLLEKKDIFGYDIIGITCAFHTYIGHLIPTTFKSPIDNTPITKEKCFEYTLHVANYINLFESQKDLDVVAYGYGGDLGELGDGTEDQVDIYLKSHGHPEHTICWEKDLAGSKWNGNSLPPPNGIEELVSELERSPFKPLSPLTLHYVFSPSFVRAGNGKVGLFIKEIFGKNRIIDYIDPTKGVKEQIDYNVLANNIGDHTVDVNVGKLTGEKNPLKQIIYICFDCSKSMSNKIDGKVARGAQKNDTRINIGKEVIAALMKRIYDFRVASVRGFIVFNDNVVISSHLSPAEIQFNNAVNDIKASGNTRLWDAINTAADSIIEYSTAEDGSEKYPETKKRVIIISDGDDTHSNSITKPQLAMKLVQNKIILDGIVLSMTDDVWDLATMATISGGMTFKVANAKEGVEIFEREAFLNIGVRGSVTPIENEITDEIFERILNECETKNHGTVEDLVNKEVKDAKRDNAKLGTPKYIVISRKKKFNQNNKAGQIQSPRNQRIIAELTHIARNPDTDNIIVFANTFSIDKWRVFIRGVKDTPYENVWWDLYVTFPPNYPNSPPNFRYISVPFHQNVSKDGRIVFKMVEQNYSSTLKINDILKGIRNLFETPDDKMPLMSDIHKLRTENNAEFVLLAKNHTTGNAAEDYHHFLGKEAPKDVDDDGEVFGDEEQEDIMAKILVTHQGRMKGKTLHFSDDDDGLD